ncbi:cysteine--tRNA ligase [Methanobacterium sp.]|uniref:cysteine--tRNA ligase n=1 Tax=Methanobacterium sp. TaxID=2164 RepID=UPI002ABA2545|nr:cysteine--tRNA ligase [Methanobacterium sp.]MDY9922391.1 cysteine--tRNA ligase [Methanobacterium sp.]
MIKVYNTLSRKKEIFKPREGNRVKIFVCGLTVYDNSHIGHARTYISFDVIARYLKYQGYSVFYLQNITDIDDKIINRAIETGEDPLHLARKFEEKYIQDMKSLAVENVNLYARATEHIPEIIKQIGTLLEKGFAYETDSGVYFDESRYPDFGKLSNRKIEDLNVHRINPDTNKRNPGDFALWKKKNEKPYWDSPWGPGRPGWHIEDTAITEEYFGPQYDIHGGGLDLIFPHHEAEIAQMESASGKKPMVRYWMHTGFLNVLGEKMSKSLGNFITIKDLLKECPPEVFRFFVLSTHYRSPIDFSQEILEQSRSGLKRIYKHIETIEELMESDIPETSSKDEEHEKLLRETRKNFQEAMDNDFNTPFAISSLFDFIREINRDINDSNISKNTLNDIKIFIKEIGNILGFEFVLSKSHDDVADELVDILTSIRGKLRQRKDYELSDEIRSKLNDLNIVIEDRKN